MHTNLINICWNCHENRSVELHKGKGTRGQNPLAAKPLGSALLLQVLLNLKAHGNQQKENMAPFDSVLPLRFLLCTTILSNYLVSILPNMLFDWLISGDFEASFWCIFCQPNSWLQSRERRSLMHMFLSHVHQTSLSSFVQEILFDWKVYILNILDAIFIIKKVL